MSRRILGVTGTRAEFGLLQPVFQAIARQPELELLVAVTGVHHLPPSFTREEVRQAFPIAAEFPMQLPGQSGRLADASAFARGVEGCARSIEALRPDWVLVLGDRIEAFAAASAAAIAGLRVAHIHGGDRAEGVADESMRHAISKLAHLHLAASEESGERLLRMGEEPERIHVVGSPAIDGLAAMPPLDEASFDALGRPEIVVLLHPVGRDEGSEFQAATNLLLAAVRQGRVLAMAPNHDPGREGIVQAIAKSGVRSLDHLPRPAWIGLLRRVRALVGNSSAGIIEASALQVPVLDVGSRQSGRERGTNVLHAEESAAPRLAEAMAQLLAAGASRGTGPYGDGHASERIAARLASDLGGSIRVAKRNTF